MVFFCDVKKTVLNRLFNQRKLRKYITEQSAIAIYKQTILSVFDYAGFMLISCNKSDREDLQVIQNDALRTCYNVKRRDKLSFSKMHLEANLLRLEQRRTFQLLALMFIHKCCRISVANFSPCEITDLFHLHLKCAQIASLFTWIAQNFSLS